MKSKKAKSLSKLKIKYVVKDVILLILVCFAYFVSVYLNGYSKTNKNLLDLVFFALVGFVGFYLVYYLILGILRISSEIKRKKRDKILKKHKENALNKTFNGNLFVYDINSGIIENFSSLGKLCLSNLNEIAKLCGCNGKHAYLSFTINDALSFANKTINIFEEKIDEILSKVGFLNLQDKPISLIEKYVENLPNKDKKQSNFTKIFNAKPVAYAFKVLCEDKLNGAINYILFEGYIVYSKNAKDLLKLEKSLLKNQDKIDLKEAV